MTSSARDNDIVALDRVEIALEPFYWLFAHERRVDIDQHFTEIRRRRSAVWNGRILLLHHYNLIDRVMRGGCFETDYANLCAWRDWEFPDRTVFNIYAAAALRGADGGFLVGQMAPGTANAGMLYFPCGTPEPDDVAVGGVLDLAGNLTREFQEETGLVIDEFHCEPGWTMVRDGCYLALLKLVTAPQTADELRARILRYIGSEKRPEFADIRILRSPSDFDPGIPRFVLMFLKNFWS